MAEWRTKQPFDIGTVGKEKIAIHNGLDEAIPQHKESLGSPTLPNKTQNDGGSLYTAEKDTRPTSSALSIASEDGRRIAKLKAFVSSDQSSKPFQCPRRLLSVPVDTDDDEDFTFAKASRPHMDLVGKGRQAPFQTNHAATALKLVRDNPESSVSKPERNVSTSDIPSKQNGFTRPSKPYSARRAGTEDGEHRRIETNEGQKIAPLPNLLQQENDTQHVSVSNSGKSMRDSSVAAVFQRATIPPNKVPTMELDEGDQDKINHIDLCDDDCQVVPSVEKTTLASHQVDTNPFHVTEQHEHLEGSTLPVLHHGDRNQVQTSVAHAASVFSEPRGQPRTFKTTTSKQGSVPSIQAQIHPKQRQLRSSEALQGNPLFSDVPEIWEMLQYKFAKNAQDVVSKYAAKCMGLQSNVQVLNESNEELKAQLREMTQRRDEIVQLKGEEEVKLKSSYGQMQKLKTFVQGLGSDQDSLRKDMNTMQQKYDRLRSHATDISATRASLAQEVTEQAEKANSMRIEATEISRELQLALKKAELRNQHLEQELHDKVGNLALERDRRTQVEKQLLDAANAKDDLLQQVKSSMAIIVEKLAPNFHMRKDDLERIFRDKFSSLIEKLERSYHPIVATHEGIESIQKSVLDLTERLGEESSTNEQKIAARQSEAVAQMERRLELVLAKFEEKLMVAGDSLPHTTSVVAPGPERSLDLTPISQQMSEIRSMLSSFKQKANEYMEANSVHADKLEEAHRLRVQSEHESQSLAHQLDQTRKALKQAEDEQKDTQLRLEQLESRYRDGLAGVHQAQNVGKMITRGGNNRAAAIDLPSAKPYHSNSHGVKQVELEKTGLVSDIFESPAIGVSPQHPPYGSFFVEGTPDIQLRVGSSNPARSANYDTKDRASREIYRANSSRPMSTSTTSIERGGSAGSVHKVSDSQAGNAKSEAQERYGHHSLIKTLSPKAQSFKKRKRSGESDFIREMASVTQMHGTTGHVFPSKKSKSLHLQPINNSLTGSSQNPASWMTKGSRSSRKQTATSVNFGGYGRLTRSSMRDGMNARFDLALNSGL